MPGRFIFASALVLGALASFLSCAAAPPETVPADPAEAFVGPPDSQPTSRANDEFEVVVHEIEHLLAAKECRRALSLIRSVMLTELNSTQERRMQLLHERAKKLYFNEQLLDAFIAVREPWVIVGAPIRGEIVVTNISDATVTLHVDRPTSGPTMPIEGDLENPAAESATGDLRPSMLRLVGNFREFWPDNSMFSSTEFHNVALDQDIVIAPGEASRIPFEIDSAEVGALSKFLRDFNVSADFYCGRVEVDGDVFHGVLKSRGARVRVFPKNAEHLAKDPVGRLREAFEKKAPMHLTLAAGFVEKADLAAAMRTLRELLESSIEGSVMERAVMCAMHILSDEDRGLDRTAWMNFAAAWRPK